MVSSVNQPGAVTSWRVKVRVVWRAEGTVEVPEPFSTGGNITINLIAKVLEGKKTTTKKQTETEQLHDVDKTTYLIDPGEQSTEAYRFITGFNHTAILTSTRASFKLEEQLNTLVSH